MASTLDPRTETSQDLATHDGPVIERASRPARQPPAADPGVPAELRAGADGLFRLWRARPDRRDARSVDQGEPDAHALAARRHRGVADAAVDREDGVRRTGRQRAAVRLAADILRPDRRGVHGRGPDHARRRRRRLAAFRQGRPSLHSGRDADRHRHRDPGRGGGRDVHRGGGAHRRRRATSARTTTCAPSSAWCRCSAGLRSRPASSRSRACRAGSPISCRARTCS